MPSKPSFEDAVAAVADGDTPNLRQLSQFVEAAGTITDSANAIVTALDDTSPLAIDWDETNELRGAIRTQAREKIWERAVEAAQALRDAVSDFVAEVRGALAEPEPEEVEQPESEDPLAGKRASLVGFAQLDMVSGDVVLRRDVEEAPDWSWAPVYQLLPKTDPA